MLTILLTLLDLVYSHSWLTCVDYSKTASLKVNTISTNLCNAFPRAVDRNNVFGQDIGLDYIPSNNVACKNKFSGTIINYQKGGTYRLIHPAKNHDAEACTNPFIPDNQLKVYFYPATLTDPDPPLNTWLGQQFLIKDFKANGGIGYQDCPDFCSNTDKAPCFNDLTIPNTLADGTYKALWFWEFNPGQFYTHCFDVKIGNGGVAPTTNPITIAPTTNPITIAPTTNPITIAPTIKPPINCVQRYRKCDGRNFKRLRCCGNNRCVYKNRFYSQCLR